MAVTEQEFEDFKTNQRAKFDALESALQHALARQADLSTDKHLSLQHDLERFEANMSRITSTLIRALVKSMPNAMAEILAELQTINEHDPRPPSSYNGNPIPPGP